MICNLLTSTSNRLRSLLILLLCLISSYSIAKPSLRVVSLSPIVSKALVMLDAEDMVVACTQWCPFADQKQIVANAIDVNIELVLRLKPDVIFASTLIDNESIETLTSLGLDVVLLPRTVSFDAMCDNLLLVADKIGKRPKAEEEISIAKAKLQLVKASIPDGIKPKVMFQVGVKPIFIAIPNTFINEYIEQAGGINIFSDLEHGTVTRESVLLRDPDAIFISSMPTAAENAKEDWLAYDELSATQKKHVVLIDQEIASSPTIHTFVEVVGIMIDVLYK